MTGTATDAEGNYSIDVPRNAVLVFSSIGYLNQEAAVEGRSVVNIMLAPDTESLEELVVVAYGTVNKKDFTGSAASLDSKKLESLGWAAEFSPEEGADRCVRFYG